MFRWLRGFSCREVFDDVPPELDLCVVCGARQCSEDHFQNCTRRKADAVRIAATRAERKASSAEASDRASAA